MTQVNSEKLDATAKPKVMHDLWRWSEDEVVMKRGKIISEPIKTAISPEKPTLEVTGVKTRQNLA